MSAKISECGRYRYELRRSLNQDNAHSALFVMLNPSTADATEDDPTIRRCKGFAERLGCRELVVTNLYALRATKPEDLWKVDDPVGPENNNILLELLRTHRQAVCAWGANAKPERVNEFLALAASVDAALWCLGKTKAGAPRHPLYLRKDAALDLYSPTPMNEGD